MMLQSIPFEWLPYEEGIKTEFFSPFIRHVQSLSGCLMKKVLRLVFLFTTFFAIV